MLIIISHSITQQYRAAASASDTARQTHIPAQSLNKALLQFAADSKLELIVKADKLRGFNSSGLDGNMTSAQALTQLLEGSGMNWAATLYGASTSRLH